MNECEVQRKNGKLCPSRMYIKLNDMVECGKADEKRLMMGTFLSKHCRLQSFLFTLGRFETDKKLLCNRRRGRQGVSLVSHQTGLTPRSSSEITLSEHCIELVTNDL